MNELPDPLTSADCDLRDFQYMPLDVQRLCDSDLAALESPEACWAALLLWCKSWHQVPCASLPDDDRVLAKFTGYQRAPEAWQAIREGALRGWIKCSDGRLYHPVVSEKANESWLAKHRRAFEKLEDRMRKKNKSRAESGLFPLELPPLETWIDMGRPLERDLFPSEFSSTSSGKPIAVPRNSAGIPLEKALKGEGEGEGEGTEQNGEGKEALGAVPARANLDTPTDASPVSRAIEIAVYLRQRGVVGANSANPNISQWSDDARVTNEILDAAISVMHSRKLEKPAGPNYLATIIPDLLNPKPVASARPVLINARDESRRHAYEVLTGKTAGSQPEPAEVINGHVKLIG